MRNAVEAYVRRDTFKAPRRIKTARQVQRGENRNIDFCSVGPEAAGHIVNQVEAPLANQAEDFFLVLAIAALKVIELGTGLAGGHKFAADARSRGSSYSRMEITACHFPFQRP